MNLVRSQTRADADRGKFAESVAGLQISDMSEMPMLSALGARIDRSWQENSRAKERMEQELLQCLRDRKGVYSTDEYRLIEQQGGSDIFMKLPTTKIRACDAHIRSVVLEAGDMAFSVKPTPIQELPGWMNEAIGKRVMDSVPRVDQQGNPVDPAENAAQLQQMVMEELERQGKKAMEGMNRKIEDLMKEGGWATAMKAFISDFSTFPAAIMKGPVFKNKPKKKYVRKRGGWKIQTTMEKKMVFETTSPFDSYPSPNAETPQDGDYLERLRLTRAEIFDMKGMDGYNDQAIDDVLIEYGRSGLTNWLWTDSQRGNLENKEYYWMHNANNEIDGLHWWGRAQGIELLEWGMSPDEITDPLADYEVSAIKIGRHIIHAVVNHDPLFRRPIWRACYEQVPGSFWGNSVPFLMRDITRMCNGCARQLQNNMAHAAGLQIEVYYDRLADETDPYDIHPNKLWQFRSSEHGSADRGVQWHQPTSNAAELMGVYNEFLPQADDATGIPRFAHGNENVGGAGDTARGLAMLMDSSAKLLRAAIGNIDNDVIEQIVHMIYDHIMRFDPDETIKGDAEVVATGAMALIQRESAREAHIAMLDITNNPVDMEIIGQDGRADLLTALINTFPAVNNSVIPTKEELIQRRRESPPQPPPEILKLQSDQQIAAAKLQSDQQSTAAKLQSDQQVETAKLQFESQKHQMSLQNQLQIEEMKLSMEMDREREKGKIAMQREELIQRMKRAAVELEIKENAKDRLNQINTERDKHGMEPMVDVDDIKTVVMAEITPLMKEVVDSQSEASKDVLTLVEKLTGEVKTEGSALPTINVNVDASCQKSGSKKVDMVRGADGNITATVTEGTEA